MDAADMSATCCSLALASMSEKDGGLGLIWRRYHLTNQQASSTLSRGVKYFDRSPRMLSRPRHIAVYIVDVPRTRGNFLASKGSIQSPSYHSLAADLPSQHGPESGPRSRVAASGGQAMHGI